MTPGGLRYYGGKHPSRGLCKWIVSMIPWSKQSLYAEPFCGMAGVLCGRAPVNCELINDRNDRLINWWQVVRDHPHDFGTLLEMSHQASRSECERARAELDCEDPIQRAVNYTIVVQSTMHHTDRGSRFSRDFIFRNKAVRVWGMRDVLALHERTRRVQIENCDAVDLMNRIKDENKAVLYVDPPYRTAEIGAYRFKPDWDALTEALLKQQGSVAVSGYNDEWDHLGWRCEEFQTFTTANNIMGDEKPDPTRTEKLWCNYPPIIQQDNLFGGFE